MDERPEVEFDPLLGEFRTDQGLSLGQPWYFRPCGDLPSLSQFRYNPIPLNGLALRLLPTQPIDPA